MRYSIALPVLATILSSVAVRAQDIDYNQIPARCRDVCNPVAALTQYCDRLDDDNDDNNDDDDDDSDDYINCVCTYPNANFQVPLCEACIRSVETDDNDVRDIIQTCRFTTTSYTAGATLAAGQSLTLTSGQNPSSTRTTTATGSTGSARPATGTTTIPAVTTSVVTTRPTSGTNPVTTSTQLVIPASTVTTTPGTGAAAATALPLVGAGAMAAMAVLCGL